MNWNMGIRRGAGQVGGTLQRALGTALLAAMALTGCGGGGGTETAAPPTPVSITTQPASASVTEGQAASFSVSASGGTPLSYQWQRDGTAIAGATSASLAIATPTAADSGAQFRVVVTNPAGSVTSSAGTLTVAAAPPVIVAPAIIASPQSANALDGGSATLSVAASGTSPFTYVWRRNGTAVADATAATYTTPLLTLADTGAVFSVVVSNTAGSATSGSATITVNPVAPAIVAGPVSVAVSAGQTASFAVTATGSATLAYQWRRNGTAISGATGSSTTTAATTTADTGARYSVVVSNGGGSVTSGDAVLTVTALVTAPTIAMAPQSLAVAEGQAASFTATATGTAPLAFQWRRNGVDIAGATQASYAIAATVIADNTARFSVRVTNAAGSATSTDAVLTVQAASSPLIGRGWSAGQLLETDDNLVSDVVSTIDDAGRATVIFRKSNGTRPVIYATRGTPNAAGTAPTWSTPVAIDLLNGVSVSYLGSNTSSGELGAEAAPGGNVLAYWFNVATCNATTYRTAGTCTYYYSARYLVASNTWEAPVLMGDVPSSGLAAHINDRGDVAVLAPGWVRLGTTSFTRTTSVFFRAAVDAAYRRTTFAVDAVDNAQLGLDRAGNMLVAGEASQNATVDLVAYRGTVAAGFGAAQVLDTRGAAATLVLAGVGLGGEQVVVWTQNNGTKDTSYGATSATPDAAFAVVDLAYKISTSVPYRRLTVSDDGQAIVYDLSALRRLRWAAISGWTAVEAMPSGLPNNPYFYGLASTRSGDILAVQLGGGGDWASYDAKRNVLVRASPTTSPSTGYVLGLEKNAGYNDLNLSLNGVGIVTLKNKFDVLPTPAAPAGDGRTITNLWGAFFK